MFAFSAVLVAAGLACGLFGAWLALNLGDAAERRAAHHRLVGNPRPGFPRHNQSHNHRPQTRAACAGHARCSCS